MTAAEFLERAAPLLLADEARHNLLLGVAGAVRDLPHLYPDARFWVVDGVAALQTPPYNVLISKPHDRAALRALVDAIDVDLPGVTAAVPEVDDFAALWRRSSREVVAQNIWALHELRPAPRPAGGRREAGDADLALLAEWWKPFGADAELARRQIEQRLGSPHGGVALWEDGGEPVAMCGYGSPTPNGIRIGPVYTRPEARGRGYATALTADVSREQLDAGRFCFLYTDATNATAERVYARLGYERVCSSRQLAFE